jgi:ATP-dependent protease ClpP protease subunit
MNKDTTRKSKKRKLNETESKRSFFNSDNKMIYAVGTELHFTESISDETIEDVIRKITKIIQKNKDNHSSDDKLKISYIVDSPGGSCTAILKFVDFINLVKTKYPCVEFQSIITGLVASAGTIMCMVADKRLMTRNSHAMIHELSSGNSGKYTHLMSYTKFLESLHAKLVNIYVEKTSKSKEEIEELLNTETWFDADSYLSYGFVDEITG